MSCFKVGKKEFIDMMIIVLKSNIDEHKESLKYIIKSSLNMGSSGYYDKYAPRQFLQATTTFTPNSAATPLGASDRSSPVPHRRSNSPDVLSSPYPIRVIEHHQHYTESSILHKKTIWHNSTT